MRVEEFRKLAQQINSGEVKSTKASPFAYKKRKPGKKSSRQSLIDRLDKWFSKYIRLRDAFPDGTFKCISCGKIKPLHKADAGHFWGRSNFSTRYDEQNVNAECSRCNRFDASHLVGYQEHLIEKIGQRDFDLLRVRHNEQRKYSDWELEELIEYYKAEVKRLSKEKGIKV